MSSETLLLWLALTVALLAINAFFVAIEFALVALRPSRVQELVDSGSSSARVVQKLQRNLTTSVSGAQLGITFASLALGWVCEPSIHALLKLALDLTPVTRDFNPPEGVAMAVSLLVMSALHVVLGEQVPKCTALRLAEPAALYLCRPFAFYCRIAWPLIWLLDRVTSGFLWIFGLRKPAEHENAVHSADELEILFDQSEQAGELDPRETEMLKGVFGLENLTAAQVMVPRNKMDCLDSRMSLRDAVAAASKTKHSKLPVIERRSGQVVGVLNVKDLFDVINTYVQAGSNARTAVLPTTLNVDALVREVYRIAATDKARDVLDEMRKRREQIAIVQDETKRALGLVTMEDIVEHLVGEIYDEYDKVTKSKAS